MFSYLMCFYILPLLISAAKTVNAANLEIYTFS